MPLVTPQIKLDPNKVATEDLRPYAQSIIDSIVEHAPGLIQHRTCGEDILFDIPRAPFGDAAWDEAIGSVPYTEQYGLDHHHKPWLDHVRATSPRLYPIVAHMHSYGVVDSPEQFDHKLGKYLRDHPDDVFVTFLHIPKRPDHGWRWHKNGKYFGDGTPEHEYLYQEKGFTEGVYVFSVHLVKLGSKT